MSGFGGPDRRMPDGCYVTAAYNWRNPSRPGPLSRSRRVEGLEQRWHAYPAAGRGEHRQAKRYWVGSLMAPQGHLDRPASSAYSSRTDPEKFEKFGALQMRQLADHIVEGDSANHQLAIRAMDERGSGGANHRYVIDAPPPSDVPSNGIQHYIDFQNGPIAEAGINGITNEALLAIVIDRLRGFQAGQFKCRENAIALTHCEDALMWLQRRTRERIKRGVEGTHSI